MTEILILLCAILVTLAPWVTAEKYGVVSLMSPLHIVAYMAFMGIFVKTIAYAIDPQAAFMTGFLNSEGPVLLGYIFVTLFIIATCIGYVAGASRNSRADIGRIQFDAQQAVRQIRRDWTLLWLALGITGGVTILYLVLRGSFEAYESLVSVETLHGVNRQRITQIEGVEGLGASFSALRSLYGFTMVAFFVYFSQFVSLTRPPATLLKLCLVSVAVLIIVLSSGSRIAILAIAMQLFCVYMLLGGRVNSKLISSVAIGFVAMALLFYLLTALRASTSSDLVSTDVGLGIVLEHIVYSSYFLDINMPAILIDRATSDDMYFGASYLYWAFGWIPRELWPDKPAVSIGPDIKAMILGFRVGLGGWNPTGPGEAYMNFGWAGPVVGFALGYGFRKLEEFFILGGRIKSYGGLWFYPFVVIPLVLGTMQSSFSITLLSTAVKLAVFFVFIKVFYYNRQRSTRRFQLQ